MFLLLEAKICDLVVAVGEKLNIYFCILSLGAPFMVGGGPFIREMLGAPDEMVQMVHL